MKRCILIFCIFFIGFIYGMACAGVNEDLFNALNNSDNYETVYQLLSKGADVNAREADVGPLASGNTPLHIAVRYVWESEKIAKLLIDRGADVNAKNKWGKTPLHDAVGGGNVSLSTVKLLVEKGADVNAKSNSGETALYCYGAARNLEVARFLIEKGADVNAERFDGQTPLHVAVGNMGSIDVVKLLIEKGANVNARDSGRTPLHIVAKEGKTDIAKLLIEKGADVNAKDAKDTQFNTDNTPLHEAAEAGKTEIVKLLIEKGADLNVINKNGETPLASAEKTGKSDMAEILRAQGAGARSREALDLLLKEMSTSNGVSFDKPKREKILELVRTVSPPPAIPAEAEKHMNRGLTAFKVAKSNKDYEEARAEFEKAANLAPWWADPYRNLGLVWDKLRDSYPPNGYKYAIDNLQFYLKVKPDAPDAAAVRQKIDEIGYLQERKLKAEEHINRGIELGNSNDLQGSVRENKEAIRLYPEYALAHANLGWAYVKLEKYQEAIPELKEAIRLYEWEMYTYNLLGFAYKKLGDVRSAINILEEGVSKNIGYGWGHGKIHQTLGWIYDENGQYEKALEQFQKAHKYADSDKEVNKKYAQEMISKLKSRLGK
jgi:ankyrin repeat protein